MDSLNPQNPDTSFSDAFVNEQLIQTSVSTASSLANDKDKAALEQGVQLAQTAVGLSKQVTSRHTEQTHAEQTTTAPTAADSRTSGKTTGKATPAKTTTEDEPVTEKEYVSAAALESIYEQVVWQILVDGKPIQRLVSFDLSCAFNSHATFTLRVYHAELEQPRAYRIDQTRHLLGKTLTAILGSHLQDDRVKFTGIITSVSFQEKNGLNGEVILSGYSPTILLDNGSHFHSFYNKDLAAIAREVTEDLAGKLEMAIKPRYHGSLPYVAQYGESSFELLNRLASWYGEWFYYNGRKLCFGKPDSLPRYKLYYARQLEDLQMDMQALPMNFTHLAYQSSNDQVLTHQPPARVEGLNFYGDVAVEKSDVIFGPVKNKPLQRAGSLPALTQAAKVNKAASAASTFTLRGSCKVPYLSVGCRITIFIGETELGEYLITSVKHHLSTGNQYTSSFTAVGGDVQTIPTPAIKAPSAEAELAVVRKNDDPDGQGRVRVQFQWQEGDNMTDWIRVMSPDAGGGGDKVAKNRGFVFIPEKGDLVMVAYKDGNPDAPFVLGSMHHGKVGGGGGKGNKTKSLTTRSGSTVTLDDDKGSVTVSDPSGNTVILHGDGTMTIKAPNKLTIESKEIHLLAENDLNLASANTNVNVSGKSEVNISSAGNLSVDATGQMQVSSQASLTLDAPTVEAGATANLKLSGAIVDLEGKATTNVKGGIVNIN